MHEWQQQVDIESVDSPPWGTTACIAGWACILAGGLYVTGWDIPDMARELLDLGPLQTDATELFYVNCWPEYFKQRYTEATTAQERAQVTADRIDYFIEHIA